MLEEVAGRPCSESLQTSGCSLKTEFSRPGWYQLLPQATRPSWLGCPLPLGCHAAAMPGTLPTSSRLHFRVTN